MSIISLDALEAMIKGFELARVDISPGQVVDMLRYWHDQSLTLVFSPPPRAVMDSEFAEVAPKPAAPDTPWRPGCIFERLYAVSDHSAVLIDSEAVALAFVENDAYVFVEASTDRRARQVYRDRDHVMVGSFRIGARECKYWSDSRPF